MYYTVVLRYNNTPSYTHCIMHHVLLNSPKVSFAVRTHCGWGLGSLEPYMWYTVYHIIIRFKDGMTCCNTQAKQTRYII